MSRSASGTDDEDPSLSMSERQPLLKWSWPEHESEPCHAPYLTAQASQRDDFLYKEYTSV